MKKAAKKFIVLVADGMADYPLDELGNRTPLEVARTPNMDYLAKNGKIGQAQFVPEGMVPGSDVANLSIFGYDPKQYYCGRGPLEATNLGVHLNEDEVAFRCNFITIENDILVDYSAGHISTKEATVLIKFLNSKLSDQIIRFHPGISYRHLMIIKGNIKELMNLSCVPPHNIMGKKFSEHLPKGSGNQPILDIMKKSQEILCLHDINQVRIDLKENPANMIWLWGQGKKIDFPSFKEKYGLSGSVISAVDLIKGIGRSFGLDAINVPGATGYYDTNYEGKAEHAVKSLEKKDFVFVHVEAPDEAGHNGDVRAKISSIENFDRYVVGTVLSAFKDTPNTRILISPDHPTPVALKTHTSDPVCFLMYGQGIQKDEFEIYNETTAKNSQIIFQKGHELMDMFIKDENI
ncbi:MAG: cofactor-independent phosphoglycerate mutase [PVC group bacterium]|nr:cofactor-independent phosphoglycerate mutase [PVC group bacterium]